MVISLSNSLRTKCNRRRTLVRSTCGVAIAWTQDAGRRTQDPNLEGHPTCRSRVTTFWVGRSRTTTESRGGVSRTYLLANRLPCELQTWGLAIRPHSSPSRFLHITVSIVPIMIIILQRLKQIESYDSKSSRIGLTSKLQITSSRAAFPISRLDSVGKSSVL